MGLSVAIGGGLVLLLGAVIWALVKAKQRGARDKLKKEQLMEAARIHDAMEKERAKPVSKGEARRLEEEALLRGDPDLPE